MLPKLFYFLLLILSTMVLAGSPSKQSLIRIEAGQNIDDELELLPNRQLDIINYNTERGYIEAIVNSDQLEALSIMGFETNPLIPDLAAFAAQLRNENYFDRFTSYGEMLTQLHQVVAEHPKITSLHDIGDSYNKRHGKNDYDIWALKISDNVDIEDDTEADVLFIGSIHAREIITPEIILFFMHYLIDGYNVDPYVTHLVNHREIWLIPILNPDGHDFVLTGDIANPGATDPMFWRKNMRDNNENGVFDYDYDGVDLNRNYGYMWGYDDFGSSPAPEVSVYRGPDAFSEPESQAIRDFVIEHNFVISLSYHSFAQLWLYPWCYDAIDPPEPDLKAFKALADSCVYYNGYRPGNNKNGGVYACNGVQEDWLYGEHGIFSYVVEVGNTEQGSFWPDTSLIMTQILENLGPNLFMAYAAGEEPIIQYDRLPNIEQAPNHITFTATIEPPILLTENIPLDSSTFYVYYGLSQKTSFDSVRLFPTGYTNEYTANIPAQDLAGTVTYYVKARDKVGRIGTLPRGAPAAVDSFIIAPDVTPPIIKHDPITFFLPSASELSFSANVTDNIGIEKVVLHLKRNSETVIEITMHLSQHNEYEAVLESLGWSPEDEIQYRITAVDGSINKNTSCLPFQDGWYTIYVLNTEFQHDFETDSICITDDKSDWQWGSIKIGPKNAHSGDNVWGTGLAGYYSRNSDSKLDVPDIYLSPDLKMAIFNFRHWYRTEPWDGEFLDGGNIKIAVDDESFQVVTPIADYPAIISSSSNTILAGEPAFAGNTMSDTTWEHILVDLSPYIGHMVRLRFHFVSGAELVSLGWYIDDMELCAYPPHIVQTNHANHRLPKHFELCQNYPNPFNPTTTIRYTLSQPGHVKIYIYNLTGRHIRTLVNEEQNAGIHTCLWNAMDEADHRVSSGIYLYRIEFHDHTGREARHSERKMVLLK